MFSKDESSKQIIKETSILTNLSENPNNQKRIASSELNNLSKKCKINNTFTNDIKNNQNSLIINSDDSKVSFFYNEINKSNVQLAIKNLNYVRQGKILPNEFDLQLIYEKRKFKIIINNDTIVSNSKKLEFKNIVFPQETYAGHLLINIMNIFSNPMNCGYFLKNELDLIFSLFTLSSESQMLFVRLLKRKLVWHRISDIKYPEIANNLDPFFKELLQNGLCVSDMKLTDISILLNMLRVQEVRNICQKLKIDHNKNKAVLISKLLKYGNASKSFFIGSKSPKCVLRSIVLQILQSCICLPELIINLFNRVLTLLHPIQDPTESIADLFLILINIQNHKLLYPPILKNEIFPIFKNRLHLIDFIKSKNDLKCVLQFIEKKEWDKVRNIGRIALEYLSKSQLMEEKFSLPLHVKKFMPEYLWIKILAKSVDAFKKTPETIFEAVNILKILINEKYFSHNQGRWYSELALIEMHYQKDFEKSAALTLHALQQSVITEVDVLNLTERLKKLMRKKSGISKKTRILIQEAQEKIVNSFTLECFANKIINANIAHRNEYGGKSKWSLSINGNNKYYGSVEMLALHYYINEENFHEGLHCEGLLSVTLFTVYFWDELYNTFVPGAFISLYQDAPLDLFTSEFFSNRKKSIEDKIKFIRKLDLESFITWMVDRYSNYSQYKSIMSNTLFESNEQFKGIISCLGIDGVTGICEKLVSNFSLWRSGFPDLIVWNTQIVKCKIIEVKGPNDFLSEKQQLWLQYLKRLGIEIELCHVKAFGRTSK